MISCKTLLYASKISLKRFITKDPDEGPVCFQLSSNQPLELAEAVKKVTDYGADLIDLNCGCPVKKIRNKGAGSRLLTQPTLLYQLITAMKQNTPLPISIKIRVEGGSDEKFNEEIATVIKEAGADFLVVHGRHWTEHYETPCRHEEIQFFVEALNIPVIGNGDIACKDSLKKMFGTGSAGIMIGRAGVGQPWLIQQLVSEMHDVPFKSPSSQEIGMLYLEHVTTLSALLGSEKFAILQARKLSKYYARHLPNPLVFCDAINTCDDLKTFEKICREI